MSETGKVSATTGREFWWGRDRSQVNKQIVLHLLDDLL